MAKKTDETTPLQQGVHRANFIRAAALEWMREHHPEVIKQIEDEAERQYPYKEKKRKVDLSFVK